MESDTPRMCVRTMAGSTGGLTDNQSFRGEVESGRESLVKGEVCQVTSGDAGVTSCSFYRPGTILMAEVSSDDAEVVLLPPGAQFAVRSSASRIEKIVPPMVVGDHYSILGAGRLKSLGVDLSTRHFDPSGYDGSGSDEEPPRPATPFVNQYPVDIGHGVLAFVPEAFQPPEGSSLRKVLQRQRSYGRDFRGPPRVTFSGASPIVRHDVSFGAKFIPENMEIHNRAIFGALSHMSVSEMLPFIIMVSRGDREVAADYWDRLAAHFPKFRIRNVFKNLYRFVRYNRDMLALAENSYAFPESLSIIAYTEQYILDFKEKNQAKVAVPIRKVELLKLAPEFQVPSFEEVCAREFREPSLEEICSPAFDWGDFLVHGGVADAYVDVVQGGSKKSHNPYGRNFRDRARLNTEIEDEKENLKAYGVKMLDSLIYIDSISKLVRSGHYAAAVGQIYLMTKGKLGVLQRAKGLYNSWSSLHQLREWKGEIEDIFDDLEEEGSLEEKEDFDEEVEVVLNGPFDFLGAFGKSSVWKKLMALIAALCAPEILYKMPGFASSMVVAFAGGLHSVASGSNLTAALLSFCRTFMDRLRTAWEEKSFWAFLREGGYETFLIRGAELSVATVKGPGGYVSIATLIEDMDVFIAEGQKYVLEDALKNPANWKMKPEHHRLLQSITVKRANWQKRMFAMTSRKKQPFSLGFCGPPGVGKTMKIVEITTFVVRHTAGRLPGPSGDIEIDANDLYHVPTDKHWNNCTNPRLLNFNDVPGTGYVNNGTAMNMADLMRLAVDVEPFYTPQADLDSKADNVIDPEVVSFTTNDMVLKFSVFGTNWEKWIRRYPRLYYIAYPSSYYKEDISTTGNGHGILKDSKVTITSDIVDQMRVYRVKAVHLGGDIGFHRTGVLEGGLKAMMLEIKREFLQHKGKVPYTLLGEKMCHNLTPWDDHHEKCMEGCNWSPPAPMDLDELYDEAHAPVAAYDVGDSTIRADLLPPVVVDLQGSKLSCCRGVVDQVADHQFNRILESYKAKAMAQFLRVKALIREYMSEILVGFASIAMAWSVGSSLVGAVKRGRENRKKLVDLWEASLSTTSALSIEGNVINPMTHKTPESYAIRYGLREAESREMPNPPKYPNNSRQHVFISPVSATSDAEDVRRLVRSNSYVFTDGDFVGVGVFVDSTTLLMNNHVWKQFKGQVRIRRTLDNGLKFFSDLQEAVHEDDLTLVRVPSFPAANLWKHIPATVGIKCDISVGSADWEPAERKLISFGVHLNLGVRECWTYKTAGADGDCGTPGVGRINGKGVWLSYHVALLANGEGAGFCMGPHVKILAAKLPPAPGQLVLKPFSESVEKLNSQSKMRSACGVAMAVIGTFENGKNNARSMLMPTEFNALAISEMREPRVIPQLQIDGIRDPSGAWKAPYVHKWNGMAFEPKMMRRDEINVAIQDYLEGRPKAKLHPLTLAQAIKGVKGDPLLKTMNMATSAGSLQRFYGGKKYVLDSEEISSELHDYFWDYVELVTEHVVAEHQKWCLKDELVTAAKESVKKYRYFMVSELPNLIAFRMFVAPLVAHMYRNKEFFEAYGAFNPASPDYGKMMDRLRRFLFLLMADIKHMDSSHKAMLAEGVADIFVQVAIDGEGYNEDSLKVVRNLVVSVVFSLIELNGDLAFVNEGMGSGVYITFIFNCLVLSILYRVAWLRISKELFRQHNVLVCGGDDSTCTTDNPKFTGVHVQQVFADYGYELTPPTAKDGAMCDFFPMSEMVFLKRTPSFCVVKGKSLEVGALDPDSIWRSLGWTKRDVAVSQSDRLAQVLDAAQREFALHGAEQFARFHSLVGSKVKFRRLTYEEVMDKYVVGKLYDDIEEYELESCLVQRVYGHSKENKDRPLLVEHYMMWGVEHLREALARERGDKIQVKVVFTTTPQLAHVPGPNWKAKPGNAKAQIHSANFIGNDQQNSMQERTAVFDMASAISSVAPPPVHEAIYALPGPTMAIQDSLKRPVHLGTITWTSLTAANNTFGNVYDLWRNDTMVESKLYGYKFWRGKPTLRFVVNGMSTYYGKLVLAVDLNPGEDGNSLYNGLNPEVNSYLMDNACQAMQTSHISVDPSESCTYDYPIPWYSATGWFNRFDFTLSPTVTLKYFPVNPLGSVSAVAPGNVTVQVYLIMEDLELSIPAVAAILGKKKSTKTMGGITSEVAPMEAKPEGTLSKGLSAVSAASGIMATVPALTPFLGPFSAFTGMASSVAGALGYSAPRAVEENYEVLNRVVSPAQYTDGRQGITVLAGDPKQSIAFTAEAAGVGEDDDMMIGKIVSKFGLLETVPWLPGDAAGASLLALSVTPYDTYTVGGGWTQFTPLSFVSNAFRYWSGSLVYRIEVVVSGFHRGCLGVSWIPYSDPPGGSALSYPNRYLTKIIDVTETKVVDMVIPYAGNTVFATPGVSNGVLRVYVINPLVTTGATAGVQFNVYHAAGDDFELYRPNSSAIASLTPIPVGSIQSGSQPSLVDGDEAAEKTKGPSEVTSLTGNLKMVSFGEGFTSIKQLANRYCVVVLPTINTAIPTTDMSIRSIPLNGVHADSSPVWTYNDFGTYFSYAFLAERGGRRWKYTWANSGPGNAANARWEVWMGTRPAIGGVYPPPLVSSSDNLTGGAIMPYSMARYGNGVHLDAFNLHPWLEFETPYIGMCQFTNPRKPLNKMSGNWGSVGECINIVCYQSASSSNPSCLMSSAADDYSLHGFFFVPKFRPT